MQRAECAQYSALLPTHAWLVQPGAGVCMGSPMQSLTATGFPVVNRTIPGYVLRA